MVNKEILSDTMKFLKYEIKLIFINHLIQTSISKEVSTYIFWEKQNSYFSFSQFSIGGFKYPHRNRLQFFTRLSHLMACKFILLLVQIQTEIVHYIPISKTQSTTIFLQGVAFPQELPCQNPALMYCVSLDHC